MRRTTRITLETDWLLVVRGAKATLAWCPDCAAEVDVLTLTAAAHGQSAEPERWMNAEKLHLSHTAEGALQICVDSLLRCLAYEELDPLAVPEIFTWR